MDAAPSIDTATSTEPARETETRGELRFVPQENLAGQVSDLRAQGSLVVSVALFGARRGSFAEKTEAAVEEALRGRGAGAQGLGAEAEPCALLSDQLFRARRLGFRGLALLVPTLKPLAARLGAIDATDAEHIRFLASATRDRPLVFVLPEEERCLPVFARTVALEDHLDPLEDVDLVDEDEESEEPPSVELHRVDADSDADCADYALTTSPSTIPDPIDEAVPEPIVAQPIHIIVQCDVTIEAEDLTPAPVAVPETVAAPEAVIEEAPVFFEPPAPEPRLHARAPSDPTDGRWKSWATALAAARGPQTLVSFERLFAQSYLPLATAIDSGLDEPKACAAREEFSRIFSRSYGESCPSFAVTGKRPKMVLDVYDIASKMARLHGARTTHLLLVDGMRYDVGARVITSVLEQLPGRATLVDRTTLFSALPTTTSRQLETLARGPIALGSTFEAERDEDPIRDRTAETVRRIKVGSRDVYKLDLLEARLKNAHDHAMESLAAIEDECTTAIAKHARTLAPRTLLLVFGDHGFRFDEGGAAVQGGASPEEVILSAYGLLVGELH